MKRIISIFLAVLMCFSLVFSVLPTANAIVMDFVSDRPGERPAERKISLYQLQRIAPAADDEFVTASIWLYPLPREQLEALVPMNKPSYMANESTPEERDAWARAYNNTRHSVYAGMTSAFRERYLDETVEIRYTDTESPGFQVSVLKSKLFSLAALDEVLWITSFDTHVYLESETPALEKIAAPVRDYMETAAPDERVPIRLWLRGESDEEAERLNPISYPTFASTAEEVQAYRTALQQAYQEISRDRIGIFVQNHLDEDDEILFRGQKTKNLIVTVPVSKIASLASLQLVSQIDPAFGYEEAFPDPELPEDPDERNKLEDSLRELMTVAGHDERIPVSLQIQTPQNPVIGECVENVLDETDQIVARFPYSSVIQVLVPKYKIAALAHLGEVTSIDWAIGYDARVYPANGGDVVYVPAQSAGTGSSDVPERLEKLSSRLYWEMYNHTEDNAAIRVRIELDAPSTREVDAMIPAPERPTMDEYIAYRDALDKNREEVYSAINSAFVQNYLNETEEQVERSKEMAYVTATVSKTKIAALAALEEVAQIDLVITDERPPAHPPVFPPFEPGPDDPVYSDKIELRLQRQMYGTADDERIPILVMLRSPSMAEIDATVPVPKDLTSAEQFESYVSEIYRTRAKTYGDISANFVYDHLLRGTDWVYYACENYPYVLAAMTRSRIAALAALDEILYIDQYDIPLFNNDVELPYIPDPAPDEPAPDAQDNTEQTIIHAANAARNAYESAVRTAQAAGLEIDADGYAHLPEELDDQADLMQLQALIESIKASKAAWDAAIQQAEALGVEIVYDEDYEPAPARPDEEPELSQKIGWSLKVKMAGTADDTRLRVRIELDAPSLRDLDARLSGQQYATADELYMAKEALYQQYLQECAAIYEPFVQNYLNVEEEQVDFQADYCYLVATLPKAKIAALAKLSEVVSISQWHEQDPAVLAIPAADPDAPVVPEKITMGLEQEMNGAAEDEIIGILLWLNAPSNKEIDATVPVPEDPTDPEQLNAFIRAAYQARTETIHGIVESFVQNHMNKTNEVQFAGTDGPYLLAATTRSRILSLTALDEVAWIDQENWPIFAQDDVPQVPVNEPELCEHDYVSVVTSPTCTERGYTTYTCSKCGAEYVGDEVQMLRHDWDEGAVTVEPTEETEGVKTYTCTRCGVTKTEAIPVKEHVHAYTDDVTAPTCTEAGFTTHTCACGESYVDSEVPALGHDYRDGVCTRCGAEDPDYVPPVVDPFRFDDVEDDTLFYYAPVYWAVEQKITKGTSEKLFSPGESCTRAQVVTFLWRAAGEPEPAETVNPFKDVAEDAYYSKAVLWAVEKGITKGTSADAFSPEAICTRAQIVTFLYRANGTPEVSRKSKPFADVDAAQYYADAVAWAVEHGITTGKSPETFAPDVTCTRAEVVTFLYRAGNA